MLQNKFCFFILRNYVIIISIYFQNNFFLSIILETNHRKTKTHIIRRSMLISMDIQYYYVKILKGVNPCVKIVYKTLLYLILSITSINLFSAKLPISNIVFSITCEQQG